MDGLRCLGALLVSRQRRGSVRTVILDASACDGGRILEASSAAGDTTAVRQALLGSPPVVHTAHRRNRHARDLRQPRRWQIVVWYVLIAVTTAIFFWGIVRLALKYSKGRAPFRFDRPVDRLRRAALVVARHDWIRKRDPLAGIGHLLIFYGFVVLFIGTAILAFQDDFAGPVLDFHFFEGWFYLGYSLFLDVFGVALIVGLGVMAVRRGILRPFRLDYWRPDREEGEYDRRPYKIGDWTFLGILFFLALTGFLLEAFRIAELDPSFEAWSPFGWLVGQGFRDLGLAGDAAQTAHFVQWWVHGLVALGFVASIPFTKAVHMVASPANVALQDDRAGNRLLPLPENAKPEEVGYGQITDLSWKHLVNLDACTKCGKCHAACPATNSGYPLSPRDLVLDLREFSEGSLGIRSTLHVEPLHDSKASVLGDPIKPETLWSCMQCMACVEICPVGIEHVPLINQMRRRLVEQGEMDSLLQGTLETIYTSGNSFGEAEAQAGALDARARLRGQGRAEAAGRPALVRRRLRVVRPTQPAKQPGARPRPASRRRRLRDPLRRREDGRQRRAAHGRGRPLRLARRGEHRDDLPRPLSAHRLLRSPHLQHAEERVSGLRRHVGRPSPLAAPPRADRARAAQAARARLPRYVPRPRARSGATTACTTRRGISSRR